MPAMKLLQELPLVPRARQMRHTFVQGRDNNYYKILTFRLYDKTPPPEFPNWETNVEQVDERGARRVLVQPLMRRFFNKDEAVAFHQRLFDHFDEMMHLPEPEPPKEHKKAEPAKPEP